jgi:putative endonuclease
LRCFFKKTESHHNQCATVITGKKGEDLAVAYLKQQSYLILHRNYRKRCGEIDIIVKDGETLVFVEVKARRNKRFGTAFEAVHFKKQQQISKAALAYLTEYNCHDSQIRFDVIAVYFKGSETHIEQLKNAFEYVG